MDAELIDSLTQIKKTSFKKVGQARLKTQPIRPKSVSFSFSPYRVRIRNAVAALFWRILVVKNVVTLPDSILNFTCKLHPF